MFDFTMIMKMKSAWDTFNRNHPKFMPFVQAVGQDGVKEGTIIEIKVSTPEGKEYNTNMKVTQSDLELFAQISSMAK